MKKVIYILIALVVIFILLKLVTSLFIKNDFNDSAEQAIENWKNESATKIKTENIISVDEYVTVEEAIQANKNVEYKIIN